MLVTALFMQYFPPQSVPSISEEPYVIMKRLADEAIKQVTTNEELHGTIESVECIMLEAQYHGNYGNLRRAWLAVRRAMMVAQLMGIDRPSTPHVRTLDTSRSPATQFIWHHIIFQDRYLSLVLGLPCGQADLSQEFEHSVPQGVFGTSWLQLELKHSQVTKRLLERRSGKDDYGITQEIDAMLLDAAKCVPDDFWKLPRFDGPDEKQSAYWRTIQAINQVRHYSLVNCLHLPYLLRETSDQKYEYSKMACLMASREIIKRYNTFRATKPILSCCRVLDFIALTAALSLALAHLNTHRHRGEHAFLPHARPGDRALIGQLLETMEMVARVNDDAMTYQSVCLLRRLMYASSRSVLQWSNGRSKAFQHLVECLCAYQSFCDTIGFFCGMKIKLTTILGTSKRMPFKAIATPLKKCSA